MSSFTPRAWKTQRDPSDEAPVGKFQAHHLVKRNNLPVARTAFIGREQDVAKITALLSEHRLITLVGSGGVGKTRLALQLATDMLDRFPDGCGFVDLAPVSDPERVISSFAGVFGVPGTGSAESILARLCSLLKEKTVLIVVDNCEHLISEVARTVDRLSREIRRARIIATSREPLGLEGEYHYRLPSLEQPPNDDRMTPEEAMQYPAFALFVERARDVARVELSMPVVATIGHIVRRLDGIALAIELAAARVSALSVQQLDCKLDQSFKLLSGGSRTSMPRQQTLRATIAWSYDLLEDDEKALLRQLAVFRGTCTLDAIENVCRADFGADDRETVDVLTTLVEKSLVVADGTSDESYRYRLLESTREFGLEKLSELGERDAAANRHSEYFAAAARDGGERFWVSDADTWVNTVRADIENYRVAAAWSLSQGERRELAATIAVSLRWYWHYASVREGHELLEKVLGTLSEEMTPRMRGACLSALALVSEDASAIEILVESSRLLQSPEDIVLRVEALRRLGYLFSIAGRIGECVEAFDCALELAKSVALPRLIGYVIGLCAFWHFASGETDRAGELFEEGESLLRRCGDRLLLGRFDINRAEARFLAGNLQGAVDDVNEAVEILSVRQGDNTPFVFALNSKSNYLYAAGDVEGSWGNARLALELASRFGMPFYAVTAMDDLAKIASASHDEARAALIFGYTDSTLMRLGLRRLPSEQRDYDDAMRAMSDVLGARELARLMSDGASMDDEAAVVEAMAVRTNPRTTP